MKKVIERKTSKKGKEVTITEHSESGGFFHVRYGEGGAVSRNYYLPTETPRYPRTYWIGNALRIMGYFLEDDIAKALRLA